MTEIQNPWHSRPIDVHRWSEHPEVKGLVDRIWDGFLGEKIAEYGRGPKPKLGFRKQLRVVILDLYVAWLDDPRLSIGVSMSVNSWDTNSRYNALHISKKIIPIIKELHEAGLIDLLKGSYGGPGVKHNRTTRIRASEALQDWFAKAKFDRDDIGRAKGEEIIVLKNDNNKQIEYEDTPETSRWREELQAYNDLIANSLIDIPSLQEPILEISRDLPPGATVDIDEFRRIRIGDANKRTRRIFSRGSWDMHGRFYGGWWQQIDSDWRSKITIDNEPTIEADFEGMHVAMIYAEEGLDLPHDPYILPGYKNKGIPPKLVRKLAKILVLTAINAKEKSSAYRAFRAGFPNKHFGKKMTDKKLDVLLGALLDRNPCLGDYLFTDQGIRLMRKDSEITSLIHNHFTRKGIPVLSVHDSYLVDCRHVGELRQVMAEASEEVVGRPLRSSYNIPGREEFVPVNDHALQWYIYSQEQSPCEGYVQRVLRFQERTGRIVSPYEREV
ncbi:hypothetical protein Q4525_20430 [Shimia thalassica]|uniref:hypothetical protein n=2 Tax=Shimia thalassica TaxID=1715693 RepID=UPI0026E2F4B5|nr:hypothetical protein [Shimia thalassica]MDO6505310.1 hypothetical protein [Shimia thalassica]